MDNKLDTSRLHEFSTGALISDHLYRNGIKNPKFSPMEGLCDRHNLDEVVPEETGIPRDTVESQRLTLGSVGKGLDPEESFTLDESKFKEVIRDLGRGHRYGYMEWVRAAQVAKFLLEVQDKIQSVHPELTQQMDFQVTGASSTDKDIGVIEFRTEKGQKVTAYIDPTYGRDGAEMFVVEG